MNLRDLEYIVRIAETGHFGRAAELCHVSQSTLSIQVKKLEETLGLQLFERSKTRILPTRAGEAILPHARAALSAATRIRDVAAAAKDPMSGELRLGAFPTLAPYLFPHIVPLLRDKLKKARLFLVEEKTDVLLAQLKSGALDCALLALPIAEEGLVTETLFEEEFLLAVPAGHALARRKSVNLAALEAEPMLLLDEGHCLRAAALELCERIGSGEAEHYRATSLETLRNMVASGGGITVMPKLAVPETGGAVRYIPFTRPAPTRRIGLAWRQSSARGALFGAVAEVVKSVRPGFGA